MSKSVKQGVRGIYLRGSTYWYSRQIEKKRHFVSLETGDLAEAIKRVRELSDAHILEAGTILVHAV